MKKRAKNMGNGPTEMRKKQSLKYPIYILALTMLLALPIPTQAQDDRPTYEELIKTNLSIESKSIVFLSGLRQDASGEPNYDGLDFDFGLSMGSGFIVRPDGTLLTNYHVIKGAQSSEAVFEDGSRYRINHIKVYSSFEDLAVLRIASTKTWPTVTLGDSDTVRPMDRIIAVGNTRGQGLAISEGIVNRLEVDERTNQLWRIRHSAPIYEGNSGGALYKGRKVIGVNSSIWRGYEVKFAIPINRALDLLNNPDYAQDHYLPDVFNPEIGIMEKLEQVTAFSAQVPATSANSPGIWSQNFTLYGLQDYFIGVECPDRDLSIAVTTEVNGQIYYRGLSDLRQNDWDAVIVSTEWPETVTISIANFYDSPVNFGLEISRIAW